MWYMDIRRECLKGLQANQFLASWTIHALSLYVKIWRLQTISSHKDGPCAERLKGLAGKRLFGVFDYPWAVLHPGGALCIPALTPTNLSPQKSALDSSQSMYKAEK